MNNPRDDFDDAPLTAQQRQAVRDVAAGRIERYGVPGEWQVFRDGQAVVFEHQSSGTAVRVSTR